MRKQRTPKRLKRYEIFVLAIGYAALLFALIYLIVHGLVLVDGLFIHE